jgi:antitoxin component YwqK of YwqJK toxin-antitoxin module
MSEKNDMKEGIFTVWYENGQKEYERNYKNGKLDK